MDITTIHSRLGVCINGYKIKSVYLVCKLLVLSIRGYCFEVSCFNKTFSMPALDFPSKDQSGCLRKSGQLNNNMALTIACELLTSDSQKWTQRVWIWTPYLLSVKQRHFLCFAEGRTIRRNWKKNSWQMCSKSTYSGIRYTTSFHSLLYERQWTRHIAFVICKGNVSS